MKKLLLALLLASALPAQAQTGFGGMFPGPGNPHTTGGGAYVGPGDVVGSVNAWWGFRAYTTATMGTKALNVCLPSDTTCADVNTDAVTGIVPNTVTIAGSTCNNSTIQCTVKTLYDKSGNGHDMTQATIANRLNFTTSCSGLTSNTPCGTAGGAVNYSYTNAVNQGTTPGYTFTCSAKRTSAFTSNNDCLAYFNGSYLSIFYSNSANTAGFYSGGGGSATGSATDSTWHALIGRGDSTTPVLYIDGTSSNGPNASSTILNGGGTVALMRSADGGGNNLFNGTFFEAGMWTTQFTPTQASNMNSNMHTGGGF